MHQEILIGPFLPAFGELVVGKHVIEGVVELIGTLFDLELLSVDLILDVINSLVKLGDVHLSILKSSLSDLVLVLEGKDLLSKLLPLKTSLELRLLNSQLSAQLIKLLLIVNSHLDGRSEVLVKLLNGDLIVEAGVLNNLDSLEDLVSILGGDGKLGDSVAEGVSCLLVLLLHQHDSTGKSSNISLNLLVLLVSLLKRL